MSEVVAEVVGHVTILAIGIIVIDIAVMILDKILDCVISAFNEKNINLFKKIDMDIKKVKS